MEGRHIGLSQPEGAPARRVTVGDEVAGWRVTSIKARRLTLMRDEREAEYRLDAPVR